IRVGLADTLLVLAVSHRGAAHGVSQFAGGIEGSDFRVHPGLLLSALEWIVALERPSCTRIGLSFRVSSGRGSEGGESATTRRDDGMVSDDRIRRATEEHSRAFDSGLTRPEGAIHELGSRPRLSPVG